MQEDIHTQNKKQLLCPSESKHRNQTSATTINYVMNST